MTENFRQKAQALSHISIIIAFLVVITMAASAVIIPLAFAFLFAIVLNPFLKRLERINTPRILGITIVLLTFMVVASGILFFMGFQVTSLVRDLPELSQRITNLIVNVQDFITEKMGIEIPERNVWMGDLAQRAAPFLTGLVQTTSHVLTILVQIPIYLFLILLYRDRFKQFMSKLVESSAARMQEVKVVVQGYVAGMFWVILILATLNSIGLLILGIPYAIFLGIFSAMLTIIPYVGNFLGGLVAVLVALVTKDSAWFAVGVIAVFAFIQFCEGNFITPNIMGSKVSINPLVALLSLIVGGQILGVAGLILALPAVGILRLVFSHSETLRPLVLLMEDTPKKKKR